MTPRIKARLKHYRMLGRIKARIRPDNRKGKSGCILWKGAIRSDEWGFYEYGIVTIDGKRTPVHRVLWEEKNGPLVVKHLRNTCGNTLCVAPAHWEAVNHPREKHVEAKDEARTATG